MHDYVHGYSSREAVRLQDQADGLSELLHEDTLYPPGSEVLEAGCGVGAQSVILGSRSPGARFTSVDISRESLAEAARRLKQASVTNVRLEAADVMDLPFPADTFDHVFVCFLLEHLPEPGRALAALRRVLRPGGTLTVIEGDHGSCYFHPETPEAVKAWRCLIDSQAAARGNSLIGRQVYPLVRDAGFSHVRVSPRMVYTDAGRPKMVEAFVRRIIIPMVEGVRDRAIADGRIDAATWEKGIRDLHATASPAGTFCYTFFKAVGVK
jgi:SAM-dependent methyltransferase